MTDAGDPAQQQAQAFLRALERLLGALVLGLALFKWATEVRASLGAPPAPEVSVDTLDLLATSPLRWVAYAITVGALLTFVHLLTRVLRATTATKPLTVARAWWSERTAGLSRNVTMGHFLFGYGVVMVAQALIVLPLAPRGAAVDAAGVSHALPYAIAPVDTTVRVQLSPGLGEVKARVTGGPILIDGALTDPGTVTLRDRALLVVGAERVVVEAPDPYAMLGVSILGQALGIVALVLGARALAGRDALAALGLTTAGFATELRRGALGLLAVLPAYAAVLALWTALGEAIGLTPAGHPLVELLEREGLRPAAFVFVSAVLLAPLQEELLYRGLLLPAYARVAGPLGALVASSLVFGAMHPGFLFLLPMAVLGSLFSGLYATSRHRSLVASITAHALFNGVTLIFVIGVQLSS